MNISFAVVQTGKRTWQLATFEELDSETPVYALLHSWKFKTQAEATLAADEKQKQYDSLSTKVCHHLAVDKSQCTPHSWHGARVETR